MDARPRLVLGHAVTVGPCLYNCDKLTEWLRVALNANGKVDTAIGVVRRGQVAGAFGFNQYYPDDGTISMHIAGRPGWLSREALAHAFEYCFAVLDCYRINGTIIASNEPSLKIARACGFVKEGRMKKAHKRAEDVLIMRQTRRQWRKSKLYIEIPERAAVPAIWHYSEPDLKVVTSGQERRAGNTRSARSNSGREATSAAQPG